MTNISEILRRTGDLVLLFILCYIIMFLAYMSVLNASGISKLSDFFKSVMTITLQILICGLAFYFRKKIFDLKRIDYVLIIILFFFPIINTRNECSDYYISGLYPFGFSIISFFYSYSCYEGIGGPVSDPHFSFYKVFFELNHNHSIALLFHLLSIIVAPIIVLIIRIYLKNKIKSIKS